MYIIYIMYSVLFYELRRCKLAVALSHERSITSRFEFVVGISVITV
jgi:hypothetical protein